MKFSEYEQQAARTDRAHATKLSERCNAAMGLAGEAGEVTDYLKKVLFHNVPFDGEKLLNETGDVLWYLRAVLDSYGYTLEDAARANIEKLEKRYPTGFTPGGGIR